MLVSAGIIEEGALFLIERALYGLQESPQDWCVERDRKLSLLRWKGSGGKVRGLVQSRADSSIWLIKEVNPKGLAKEEGNFSGPVLGIVGVYVDDLLITADKNELRDVVTTVSQEWRCCPAQWLSEGVTFCGLEIAVKQGLYLLHQAKYIAELRQRHADIKPQSTLPQFKLEDPQDGGPEA